MGGDGANVRRKAPLLSSQHITIKEGPCAKRERAIDNREIWPIKGQFSDYALHATQCFLAVFPLLK